MPVLNPDDSYHPKRNQARQKLATLSAGRFKELVSDVCYETERRFPDISSHLPLGDSKLPVSPSGLPQIAQSQAIDQFEGQISESGTIRSEMADRIQGSQSLASVRTLPSPAERMPPTPSNYVPQRATTLPSQNVLQIYIADF